MARFSGLEITDVDRRFGQHQFGDGGGLTRADLVQIEVEPTLEPTLGVGRRSTVTDKNQHAAEHATPACCN